MGQEPLHYVHGNTRIEEEIMPYKVILIRDQKSLIDFSSNLSSVQSLSLSQRFITRQLSRCDCDLDLNIDPPDQLYQSVLIPGGVGDGLDPRAARFLKRLAELWINI